MRRLPLPVFHSLSLTRHGPQPLGVGLYSAPSVQLSAAPHPRFVLMNGIFMPTCPNPRSSRVGFIISVNKVFRGF